MNFHWFADKKNELNVQKRQFDNQSREMPLRKRNDSVVYILIITTLLSLSLLITISVQKLKYDGYFEQPLFHQLQDERLLANIRNDKEQPEFLSATLHQGQVYISKKDGGIHIYSPQTGLWTTEYPFKDGVLNDSNLVMLRSGCGTDPISDRITSCPDNQTLWAVTAKQGLVRRLNGKWEILAGDTTFRGSNGQPIQSDQLNSAAVSDDGKWLILGTTSNGVGLYNLATRSWANLGLDFFKKFPSPNIKRVISFHSAFWIGTDLGLIKVDETGGKFIANQVTKLPLEISDIDISSEGELWVLGTLPCNNQKDLRCSWMGKFRNSEQVDVILNETNRYPDLDLANLIDVQIWGDRVVMSGKSGIVVYNPIDHSWNQLFSEPIELTLDILDKNGFYFISSGKVGRIAQDEEVVISDLPEVTVQQLTYGNDGRVLVLTSSGNVFAVQPGISVDPIFTRQETKLAPNSFKRAVAIGDQIVMIGEKGALLHDVRNRTYQDIEVGFLPGWFTNPDNQFISSGGFVFVLNQAKSIYVIQETKLTNLEFYQTGEIAKIVPLSLPVQAKSWWKWEDEGMGILTEQGQVFLVGSSGITEKTGTTPNDLPKGPINDVAELPDQLAVATEDGVRLYNTNQHSWSQLTKLPDGQQPIELAKHANQILATTNLGSLTQINASSSSYLAAKPYQLHVNDQNLSDVLLDGKNLYLAGNGWIDVYNTEQRTISNSYNLNTFRSVQLFFIQDGEPISLSGEKAFLGEQIIDSEAGPILGMTSDGSLLWTVRQGENGSYLKSNLLKSLNGDKGLCFFRTPRIAGVNQIYDARQLPNGSVVTSTDMGLFLYSPSSRSWFSSPVEMPSGPLRLYVTSKYLIIVTAFVDENGYHEVITVPIDNIIMPDSCSQQSVSWTYETTTVRAISVDEIHSEMLMVSQSGAVVHWQDGIENLIQTSNSNSPVMSELHRFYNRNNEWVFTTNNAIWIYDTMLHQWKKIDLLFPSGADILDLDIEWPAVNEMVVMAKGALGEFYSGKFDSKSPNALELRLFYSPKGNNGFLTPSTLLDVQSHGNNLWGFLMQDRAILYNPKERRWIDTFQFPESDISRVWGSLFGIDILKSNQGQRLWINNAAENKLSLVPYDLQPGEITAFDPNRTIWRYTPDGNILQCKIINLEYKCDKFYQSPFLLNPQNVLSLFSWNSLHWFQFKDTLRIYDPNSHQEVNLPNHNDEFKGIIWARHSLEGLFLFRTGELLFSSANNNNINGLQSYATEKVVFDSTQTVWAKFIDGWKVFQNAKFVTPGKGISKIFVFEGTIPSTIDFQNNLLRWQNGNFLSSNLSLPNELSASDIVAIIPHFNNNFWVVEKDRIIFLRETICETKTCLIVGKKSDLPYGLTISSDNEISGAQIITNGLVLFLKDGKQLSFQQVSDGSLNLTIGLGEPTLSGTMANEWPKFSSLVARLPNGQEAFDPALEIKISAEGKLVARRIASQNILSDSGSLFSSFSQLPTLDAGWLVWDRDKKSFRVSTATDQVTFQPEEFIRDGKMIFESIDAILVSTGGQFLAANSYGIWTYHAIALPVDDTKIQYIPVNLVGPISAAHGRFYSSNGEIEAGQTKVNSKLTAIDVKLGDAVIQEDPLTASVNGWLQDGNTLYPAAANQGFLWDSNLRGIAHSTQEPIIQTDAGILTLNGYDLVLPANSLLNSNGTLVSENKQAYLAGAEWYDFSGNAWQKTNNPTANRNLLDNSIWKWAMECDLKLLI